jgi:hypothetical protein
LQGEQTVPIRALLRTVSDKLVLVFGRHDRSESNLVSFVLGIASDAMRVCAATTVEVFLYRLEFLEKMIQIVAVAYKL